MSTGVDVHHLLVIMKGINSINNNLHQIRMEKDLRRNANAGDPGGNPRGGNGGLRFFAWAFLLFSLALLGQQREANRFIRSCSDPRFRP